MTKHEHDQQNQLQIEEQQQQQLHQVRLPSKSAGPSAITSFNLVR